jgi:hypothetical protein
MSDNRDLHALMTSEKAIDCVLECAWLMLKECDEVRLDTAVPDPRTVKNLLLALGSTFFDELKIEEEQDTQFSRLPLLNRRARALCEEWWGDWDCQGWLDDGESNAGASRSVASPCSVNPYCWFSIVVSTMVACQTAVEQIVDQSYPKNNGKQRNYGVVSSRLKGNKPERGVGRPKKPVPANAPPPPPKRPKGRPAKKICRTRLVDGVKMQICRDMVSQPTGFPVGRPKGSKDSPDSNRAKQNKINKQVKKGNFNVIPP